MVKLQCQIDAQKRYVQTVNGRQHLNKAKKRYNDKPYYCSVCDKHLLMMSKFLHVKSQTHIKNNI